MWNFFNSDTRIRHITTQTLREMPISTVDRSHNADHNYPAKDSDGCLCRVIKCTNHSSFPFPSHTSLSLTFDQWDNRVGDSSPVKAA